MPMAMVANVSVLMPSYEWLIYGRHLQQAESELRRIPILGTSVNKVSFEVWDCEVISR
jgi:hypothetical protein